ncbi:4Fe-4S binding protein [Nonomuraea sp. NPDC050153]|uniref:NuoI/complex I 23 kDa subunit family protein n=1 Tax=Nonomuraea sp. NPDC050153 TaxID=3364359 RepID=UPI0037A3A55F
MLRKSVTQQYPEVKPALPPRSRGVIALVEENCTSCMLCARECPDWCIYIDSHKETIPAPEGGRPRQRNVLDRFAIDFSLCMYCGICIEVCPFDALFWSPEFEYAEGDIRNLIHEKDKLAAWTQTVPLPPAHDPGAEPPKELTAAPRRPAAARTPRTAPQPRGTTGAEPSPRPVAAAPAAGTSGARPTPDAAQEETKGQEPTTGATQTERPAGVPATPPETAAPGTTSDSSAPGTSATAPGTDAQDGEPTANTPGPGPATRAPAGRPRRPIQNVRGIRPPGALPSRAQDDRPPAPGETNTGAPGSTASTAADRPTTSRPAEEGETTTADSSVVEPPQGQASSTEQSSPEKLSTASGAPQPEPGPEEQTSAASPRRRRMADPRSIRPPGRLGPDETREPEEES